MELKILIFLHVLGACIWAGGHLILCLVVLPKAWKQKDTEAIQRFERPYEKIGIPALLILVLTGIRMAMIYLPVNEWLNFNDPVSNHIGLKLILLLLTILLAIHARFFIIPKLTPENIGLLGSHIIGITIIAVLLVLTGVSFRMSILF